jgi:tetratricopeptide (TPR) repeat protein
METGNFFLAREYLEKTQAICREQSNARIESLNLCNLARIDFYEDKYEEALKKIDQAYPVFKNIDSYPDLYRCELILLDIYRKNDNFENAIESVTKAKEYSEKIGNSNNEFLCSFLLEVINYQSGILDDLSKIERLKKDLPEEDEIKAVFYYELWKVSSGKKKDQYASASLEIYERLNDTKQKYEYNQRIKELK